MLPLCYAKYLWRTYPEQSSARSTSGRWCTSSRRRGWGRAAAASGETSSKVNQALVRKNERKFSPQRSRDSISCSFLRRWWQRRRRRRRQSPVFRFRYGFKPTQNKVKAIHRWSRVAANQLKSFALFSPKIFFKYLTSKEIVKYSCSWSKSFLLSSGREHFDEKLRRLFVFSLFKTFVSRKKSQQLKKQQFWIPSFK